MGRRNCTMNKLLCCFESEEEARPTFVLGSYATCPNLYPLEHPDQQGLFGTFNPDREQAFYTGLKAIEQCAGLEVQLDHEGQMHCFDEKLLLEKMLRPDWCAVLTCIGGTMHNVNNGVPGFGLASTDLEGRKAAIEFAKKALAAVGRWNKRPNREATGGVLAVLIHSAPNNTKEGSKGSTESFVESLKELMSWDWEGAKLVVEHCDAPPEGVAASKGFLPISDEIAAIQKANADGPNKNGPVGLSINWARSVLELRDADGANKHTKQAAEAGVLSGVIFSGCTPDADSPYGPWKDCHMPHTMSEQSPHGAATSLMSNEAINQTIKAAGGASGLLFCGAKITRLHSGLWIGSEEDDSALRASSNQEILQIITAACNGAPEAAAPEAAVAEADCSIGGAGSFKLTCNVISRGGTEVVVLECSPQEVVMDLLKRASPTFEAELRHKGEADNQPKDLGLIDVGFSQDMECDVQVQCAPRE